MLLHIVPFGIVDRHLDEKTRIKDSDAKSKMKCFADTRNNADYRNIKVGDSVLMKHDQCKAKLLPMFENPETVTAKKGSMVTVDDNRMWNVSRFKKIGPELSGELFERLNLVEGELEIQPRTVESITTV